MELVYEQCLPYKLLKREVYENYEKAYYWGEKWIEKQKDSYVNHCIQHAGPDFYYSIYPLTK